MAIFRYTLKKYLKAKSTWIIVALGFAIAGLLGGILPWSLYNPEADLDGTGYSSLLIGSVSGMTSMLAIFTSIFAGYKAATMYKDEVEDGTFLVILSKPQSRFKIIIAKWFALQTITIAFLLFLVGSYGIINMMNDEFPDSAPESISSFSSQAWTIMGGMLGVIFVASLIFSSIGLLISTRTGTSAAIGISTSIGVIIPITGLLQTFTQGSEFEQITNGSFELTHATAGAIFGEAPTDNLDNLYDYLSDEDYGLFNMAFTTSEADSYRVWSYLDINYQMGQLSSYASENVISTEFRDIIAASTAGERGGSPFSDNSRAIVADDNIIGDLASDKAKATEAQAHLDEMIYTTLDLANTYATEDLAEFLSGLQFIVHTAGHDIEAEIDGVIDGDIEINFGTEEEPRMTTLLSLKELYQDMKETEENFTFGGGKMLYSVLDESYISSYAKDLSINNAQAGDITIIDPNGTGTNIILTEGSYDHKIYSYMSNLVTAGEGYVNMTTTTPYIKKGSILIAYLLIAFALVPLSIFIVKKQDFR